MGVGSYEADAPELLALGDCDDGLCADDPVRERHSQEGDKGKQADDIPQPWSRLAEGNCMRWVATETQNETAMVVCATCREVCSSKVVEKLPRSDTEQGDGQKVLLPFCSVLD